MQILIERTEYERTLSEERQNDQPAVGSNPPLPLDTLPPFSPKQDLESRF